MDSLHFIGYPNYTNVLFNHVLYQEKKEGILLTGMTKAPTSAEMSKGQSDNTNNATKSSVANRLGTVSWSNYGHLTGVFNQFTGPTFPLPAAAV